MTGFSEQSVANSINSRTVGASNQKGLHVTRAVPPEKGGGEKLSPDVKRRSVDLCFLLDATLSMKDLIGAAKDKIKEVAHQVQNAEGYTLRVGFVAYRDFDIVEGVEVFPFTYDVDAFAQALSNLNVSTNLKPGGQKDEPEDVFSGLECAMSMDWQSRVRAIVHIGDAPQHGRAFHDFPAGQDNFINGDPEGRDLKMMLRYLRLDCRVNLYQFLHLVPQNTRKMVQQFKAAANADQWLAEKEMHELTGDFAAGCLDAVHSSIVMSNKS